MIAPRQAWRIHRVPGRSGKPSAPRGGAGANLVPPYPGAGSVSREGPNLQWTPSCKACSRMTVSQGYREVPPAATMQKKLLQRLHQAPAGSGTRTTVAIGDNQRIVRVGGAGTGRDAVEDRCHRTPTQREPTGRRRRPIDAVSGDVTQQAVTNRAEVNSPGHPARGGSTSGPASPPRPT